MANSFSLTRRRFALSSAALAATWASPIRARDGGDVVKVGMTTAMEGPAKALGRGMHDGLKAHFDVINKAGGVHGRRLELVVLDDGYEPKRAAANMRKLIDEMGVFAILGNAGTPTAAVTVPIAVEKKVPLFGAFTGAGLLRKTPPDRYILNYRASYAQETSAMVNGVVKDLGIRPEQVGFFTQNDAYGSSGYNGGIAALEALGFDDARKLPHGRYARNTLYVEDGLSRLMDPRGDVRAVIMVGAYGPCSQMIRLARKHDFHALCMNVSFVGSQALANALDPNTDGVVVTQVVPHPTQQVPAAQLFRQECPADKQSFISFEGHLVARAFVKGLHAAGQGADREAWIDAMEAGGDFGLGLGKGAAKPLTSSQHQISHRVWPTVLRGGQFRALDGWAGLRRNG